jgi:hypothetical protein
VNQHILEGLILKPAPPARLRHGVRNAGHVFGAPGKDDLPQTGLDHGHAGDRRLHARCTNTVDGDGRDMLWNVRQEGRHTGDVEGIRWFKATAVANVIKHAGLYPGSFNRRFHRDTGDRGSVHILQGPPKGPDGCPASGYNHDIFFHSNTSILLN